MFLNKKVFKRLMTQAYKEGLKVAMSFDGWLYLAGQYWEVSIKKRLHPKRNTRRYYRIDWRASGTGRKVLGVKRREPDRIRQ